MPASNDTEQGPWSLATAPPAHDDGDGTPWMCRKEVAAVNASAGDWLIVKTRGEHERRGVILAVRADGSPPYTVRWTDDGHESVVFPGPDAIVMSASAMGKKGRMDNERINQIQSAISGHGRQS